MKNINYNEFTALAESGVSVHGKSLRLEFTYQRKPEKVRFASLADVDSQQAFEYQVQRANEKMTLVRLMLKQGVFTADSYAEMFPESGFANKRGGGSISTFGAMAEKYLEAQVYCVERAEQSPQTLRTRTLALQSVWLDPLPKSTNRFLQRVGIRHARLCDITPSILTQLKNYLRHEVDRGSGQKGFSAAHINNILDAIRQVFKYAVSELGLLAINPAANLSMLKKPAKTVDQKSKEFFTYEEQDALYAACQDIDKAWLGELYVFGCYTGLRKEELMALAWEDVDLDQRCVWIRRAYTLGIYKDTKNTGSTRKIGLLKPAVDALQAMQSWTAELDSCRYDVARRDKGGAVSEELRLVFMNFAEKGGLAARPWNETSLRKAWNRARTTAKVTKPLKHVRDTFSVMAMTKGVDIVHLSKNMGHTSTEMLMSCYGGVSLEFDQNLINHRDQLFGFAATE